MIIKIEFFDQFYIIMQFRPESLNEFRSPSQAKYAQFHKNMLS